MNLEEVYNMERKGSLASPRLNIGALGCMTEHGLAYFDSDKGVCERVGMRKNSCSSVGGSICQVLYNLFDQAFDMLGHVSFLLDNIGTVNLLPYLLKAVT